MVYYSINPQVLFRHFGDFGYLTDNRNYGYTFSDKKFVLGDEIISDIGADILSCLEKKPCSIDEITNRASKRFEPTQNLRNNIITFLDLLSSKGFVNKASSPFDVNKGEQLHNIYKERAGIFQHNEEDKSTIKTTDFLLQHFGDKTFLKSLHIEIVSECNERCIHCYIPHEFKTELMEESLFFSILEQAKKLNLLHITISGGEPMLHPHFLDFVKKCRECDMSVNVLSNLTKLNSTMIDEMKRNPLLCVQTSIYSMDPEVHDHITCHKGSLKKNRGCCM